MVFMTFMTREVIQFITVLQVLDKYFMRIGIIHAPSTTARQSITALGKC